MIFLDPNSQACQLAIALIQSKKNLNHVRLSFIEAYMKESKCNDETLRSELQHGLNNFLKNDFASDFNVNKLMSTVDNIRKAHLAQKGRLLFLKATSSRHGNPLPNCT